ncbi:MAG: hypothetical protein BWY79_01652 [Actinobacteria bacterium ADurb.Bin444]|nr:MAG: hypothetical protein BWY79_01652 [Actinobacteria bacterium ADurb.Bin444]
MKCLWGFTLFGFATTMPRSTWVLSMPRSKIPTLSPARASSNILRNISRDVATDLILSSCMPTISTSAPGVMTPRSIRPVTTVPRPVMVNTSSMGIRKGFSVSRTGSGMKLSQALMSSMILSLHSLFVSDSRAFSAEPRTMGVSSPGKLYLFSRSRTSISTRSRSSGSSTMSTLFMNTTRAGTFTWRANNTCSRVWGMGPSAADTTRMAPSIWAAPVIMFLM